MPNQNLFVAITAAIAFVASPQSVFAKPLAKGEHLKEAQISHRKEDPKAHSHPSTSLQTNPSNVNRANTGGAGGKHK